MKIPYAYLSTIYDTFMAQVSYETWAAFIEKIIDAHIPNAGLVLDMACGTGSLTTLLKKYEIIALDNSIEMLTLARQKAEALGQNILFLHQDMCSFELYGTVDACISTCDSLNYITNENDLFQVFKLVNNYLNPGGIFIFDINTVYKYEHILGDNQFSQVEENSAVFWENYYHKETNINEYAITIFSTENGKTYIREEEVHYQKAYTQGEIEELIKEAGLKIIEVYDEYTFSPPRGDSQRIVFVAKKL